MERRTSPRIPLDMPCLLTLLVNGADTCPAMVVDVSRGGVQLRLSPDAQQEAIAPEMSVTLQDVSAPLTELLEGAHGNVAWVGERCCGIRLDKELAMDPSALTDLARL